MPSWCTLYKGLITLVVFLIIVEYFFGTIEYKHLESVFNLNNSRIVKMDVEQIHSPLLKSLVSSSRKNVTNKAQERIRSEDMIKPTFVNATNFNLTTTANTSNLNSFFEIVSSTEESSANKNISATQFPLCPENPPGLGTTVKVIKSPVPTILQLEKRFSWLEVGGHWKPEHCRVLTKVAIIVPFRCRAEHLLLFLQHMHPFLKKQQVDYTIYIIEQDGEGAFNRASLMNVGFKEALKLNDYDCFIFHDIDLLPEDERNLYNCPEQPRHMSVAVDEFSYKLPYPTIFGGVSAITREHFLLLNGFSNAFWGWGGEDDDMSNRITYHNLYISRYPNSIARYTMLTHKKEKANPDRYETLKTGKQRFDKDGLSNLKYNLKQIKKNLLYTWLLVEVGPRS